MPLGRGKATPSKARAMTASAARLKVDKRVRDGRAVRKPADWQERAFGYYDDVPEVGDGVNFFANSCSRLRFFAAVLDDEGQPRPVNPDDDGQALYDACIGTMALIGDGPAQAAVTRPLAVNLELTGECYLQGIVDPVTGDESIRVRSVSEVDDVDGKIAVRDAPGATAVALDPKLSPTMDRVWRPHPRFSTMADSPMVRLLGVCEELLLLSQAERAGDRQRLARSGLALFDARLQLPPAGPDDDRGTAARLMDMVYDAATSAISDEGSAAAAIPIFAECEPGQGQKVSDMIHHLTFDRPADPGTVDRRDRLIRRVGHGLDLPPDVLTGMQNIKYTNAIQIDKNVFRHYVEPFAVVMADALAVSVLRPGLLTDETVAPDLVRQVFVWYDPTELVSEPDLAEPSQAVYDAGELSGAALRRYHSFNEDDAPTPVERALRLAEKMRLAPEAAQALVAAVATGQVDVTDPDGVALSLPAPAASTSAPPSGAGGDVIDGEAVTAAAPTPARVSLRPLVDLDRDVRTRVHVECELAVAAALRKAGSRLATTAQKDTAARGIAASASRAELPAILGPAVCAALVAPAVVHQLTDPTPALLASVAADELLRGAMDDLRSRVAGILSGAQTRASDLAAGLVARPSAHPVAAQIEAWLTAALDYLTGSLGQLLSARLFSPAEPSTTVPLAVARATVAITAGLPEGHSGFRPDGLPVVPADGGVGLATGRISADVFRSAGVPLIEYEWDYGITSVNRRFEPHYALNGLRFTSMVDPALANPESFPPEPFYAAGDHDGCACDVIPIYDASQGMAGTGDDPNYGPDEPVYAEPIAAAGGVR